MSEKIGFIFLFAGSVAFALQSLSSRANKRIARLEKMMCAVEEMLKADGKPRDLLSQFMESKSLAEDDLSENWKLGFWGFVFMWIGYAVTLFPFLG